MEADPALPRILVIRPGAMGDILVATPVLPNLRHAFPGSHIAFLVDRRFASVLEANPYIDEMIVFDKESMGRRWTPSRIKREMDFIAEVRARRFDMVFDLLGSLRSAILSLRCGAKVRVGYSYRIRKYFYNRMVIARNPQYVVEFNLDSLRRVGIPIVSREIHLPVRDTDVSFAGAWLSEKGVRGDTLLVGLFPGGGWQSKRWPERHFSVLGDLLARRLGAVVLIMGGPMEKGAVDRIASAMSSTPLRVEGLSLSNFAGLVSRLDLFVSNDSGPRYLAVAAGVPSVGLFGPTIGSNANPPDPKHVALSYGGECRCCNKLFCFGQECMKGIEPEGVYEEAVRLLEERGSRA
jgi:ADP-heptose:LPS heptosyltransferase